MKLAKILSVMSCVILWLHGVTVKKIQMSSGWQKTAKSLANIALLFAKMRMVMMPAVKVWPDRMIVTLNG